METMPVTIDEQPLTIKPDLVSDNFDEMLGGETLAYSSSESENDDTSCVQVANSDLITGLADKKEIETLKQNGSTLSSPISQVDVVNDIKEDSSEIDRVNSVFNGLTIPVNGVNCAANNELSEDLLLNDNDDESDIGLLQYSDVDEDKLLADIPFNDADHQSDIVNCIEKAIISEQVNVAVADVSEPEIKESILKSSNVDGELNHSNT